MKKIKKLEWKKGLYSYSPIIEAKGYKCYINNIKSMIGCYTIFDFWDGYKYRLNGGAFNRIRDKGFNSLKEAKEYAQAHFEKELTELFQNFKFGWVKGIDDCVFDYIISPTFEIGNYDIIPEYAIIMQGWPSGYFIYADFKAYYNDADGAIGRADTPEKAQSIVERWYRQQLDKLFFEETEDNDKVR